MTADDLLRLAAEFGASSVDRFHFILWSLVAVVCLLGFAAWVATEDR